jgi:hypothetical protein
MEFKTNLVTSSCTELTEDIVKIRRIMKQFSVPQSMDILYKKKAIPDMSREYLLMSCDPQRGVSTADGGFVLSERPIVRNNLFT